MEQFIDSSLQEVTAEGGRSWDSGLSRIVASYVSSSLPYHVLVYSDNSRTVTSAASLPPVLASLRRRRAFFGRSSKESRAEHGDTSADDVKVSGSGSGSGGGSGRPSVDEMEEQVRAMLTKEGRVYDERVEPDDIYLECAFTSEYAVLRGEHVTLQQSPQPTLITRPVVSKKAPSSFPPPPPRFCPLRPGRPPRCPLCAFPSLCFSCAKFKESGSARSACSDDVLRVAAAQSVPVGDAHWADRGRDR